MITKDLGKHEIKTSITRSSMITLLPSQQQMIFLSTALHSCHTKHKNHKIHVILLEENKC